MTIEILYPDLCNLYGEQGNSRYLRLCLPEAVFYETTGNQEPAFCREQVDFVYMGAMPDLMQHIARKRLEPHAGKLRQRVEEGMVMLATGNAMELFGTSIREGNEVLEGLGWFGYETVRQRIRDRRHNSMFLGTLCQPGEPKLEVVGYKSQFSQMVKTPPETALFQVQRGVGSDGGETAEGIRYRNFFGTYLLGPLLVLNPPFTRYLLGLLGHEGPLALEEDVEAAYRQRLKELKHPRLEILQRG